MRAQQVAAGHGHYGSRQGIGNLRPDVRLQRAAAGQRREHGRIADRRAMVAEHRPSQHAAHRGIEQTRRLVGRQIADQPDRNSHRYRTENAHRAPACAGRERDDRRRNEDHQRQERGIKLQSVLAEVAFGHLSELQVLDDCGKRPGQHQNRYGREHARHAVHDGFDCFLDGQRLDRQCDHKCQQQRHNRAIENRAEGIRSAEQCASLLFPVHFCELGRVAFLPARDKQDCNRDGHQRQNREPGVPPPARSWAQVLEGDGLVGAFELGPSFRFPHGAEISAAVTDQEDHQQREDRIKTIRDGVQENLVGADAAEEFGRAVADLIQA